ncbi:MAG: DNA-binding protein [Blastocatellales bacterium]
MKKGVRSFAAQTANDSDDLPAKLARPAQRALARAGISRHGQLTETTEAELAELHGMGPKALGQLRDALTAIGKSFAKTNQ